MRPVCANISLGLKYKKITFDCIPGEWNQVGLELVEVDVKCAIEP